jgi:VanZ family protein
MYGSFVPFNFQYVSLGQAFLEFQAIFLNPKPIHSNTNLLANVLIGIPGSFLFLAVAYTSKRKINTTLLVLVSILYCAALAHIAEFTQIYFYGRMTLLSDILAQTSGGVIGALIWFFIGKNIRGMLDGLYNESDKIKSIKVFFLVYVFFVFFVQLLPLDLTARLGAIYGQFQDGKIILIPFSTWSSVGDFLISLPIGLVWIPVGWILVSIYRWSFFSAFLLTFMLAFLIELIQLFIFSRITDVNDIIISCLGSIIGSSAAFYDFNKGSRFFSSRFFLIQFSFILWTLFIIYRFWSPFDFMAGKSFLLKRIQSINLIPFKLYVEKPYLYSLYNIIEIIAYFIPFGIIIYLFVRTKISRDNYKIIFFIFTIGTCFFTGLIEIGQIFIPSRYPDITDWLLMIVGAYIGFLFFQLISFPNRVQ